ncbi:MAG: HTH domain-containing protein, partial [Bacilli bacterium]
MEYILNEKQRALVKLLYDSQDYLSSEQISLRLNLSTKTINRYIKLINYELKKYYLEIVSNRGLGYQLKGNGAKIKLFLFNQDHDEIDVIKDMALCLINNHQVSIEELSSFINYSVSATNKMISAFKEYLLFFEISLDTKNQLKFNEGTSEKAIRKLIYDCAFKVNSENVISSKLSFLESEDINKITKITINYFKGNDILLSNNDMLDLITRLCIIYNRNQQELYYIDDNTKEKSNEVLDILKLLEENFNLFIPQAEAAYLSFFNLIFNHHLSKLQIKEQVQSFVLNQISEMETLYPYFIINKKTIVSLIDHLILLLYRLKQNQVSKNSLLKDIKASYTVEMLYA